jgi:deoxycytidylate deaminase
VVIARRYATVKKTVRRTVGDAGSTQGCRVTATGFPGGQTEGRKMATEGHRRDGKKIHQQPSKDEMDKELAEIRARMEELALQMQQDARSHWVYEWPMKMKVKWPVRELLARRQRRLLKMMVEAC